jgi:hypothetical protein
LLVKEAFLNYAGGFVSVLDVVFSDYVGQYTITDLLFPYTPRFIEMLLSDTAKRAVLQKKK